MSPDQRPLSNERGRHLTHYWVLFDQLNEPFGWYMWVKYLWIVQGWLFRNLEEETTPATITSWSATETFFLNLCSILHHFWRVSHFAGLNLRWPDKTAAGPPKKYPWSLKNLAGFWKSLLFFESQGFIINNSSYRRNLLFPAAESARATFHFFPSVLPTGGIAFSLVQWSMLEQSMCQAFWYSQNVSILNSSAM